MPFEKRGVDLEKGALAIWHSKGSEDREVLMPEGLALMCGKYAREMERAFLDSEWFFPGMDKKAPLCKD
jgi:hypothetical protein